MRVTRGGSPLIMCGEAMFMFSCRGDYTGEENQNYYSRSPLSEPDEALVVLFFIFVSGRFTG